MTEMITVSHLNFAFQDRTLYHDLSFSLARGSMTSLIGENGVGKTTLIRLLMGQLTAQNGTITRAEDLRLGYVPQFRNIDSEYPLTIRSFVQLNQHKGIRPWHTKKEQEAVDAVLEKTGLSARANQLLGPASGGEKQKAYLAQALLDEPNLLILDEATASLDVNTKIELMNLVRDLNREYGLTVLFVTHDLPLAKRFTDQYLLLTESGGTMQPTAGMATAAMPEELQSVEEVR